MQFGLVSNSWRAQLQAAEPLDALIAEALRRGYRAIELRQTCLGRYERGAESVPDADALAKLADRFPEAKLNLALAWPCFSPQATAEDRLLIAGIDAALALAADGTAHLR